MKILYDHQIFIRERYGGVSRYFSALLKNIPFLENTEVSLKVRISQNEYIKKNNKNNVKYIKQEKSATEKIRLYFINTVKKYSVVKSFYDTVKKYVGKKDSIIELTRGDFDIFHPTGFDPYFLPYLKNKPYVVTVHDMVHELYPQYFKYPEQTSQNKKILLKKANGIIAISNNTKKDLVSIFNIPPEKIEVVHHGMNIDFTKQSPVDIPHPYVLFVGGRGGYKNFEFLIRAITPVLNEKKIHLFCTGSDSFTAEEVALLKKLRIDKFVIQRRVSDTELAYLYSQAKVFVFPSLYEGFGIPILEAFASNCPVLLSDASCFREIAGNAASYFDIEDPESLKTEFIKLLEDTTYREKLIQRGKERLLNFSEEKCARETLAVYKKVLRVEEISSNITAPNLHKFI